MTNMPEDRYRVIKAFDNATKEHVAKGGSYEDMFDIGMTLRGAAHAIQCHTDKASRVLEELEQLGVIRKYSFEKWYRNL